VFQFNEIKINSFKEGDKVLFLPKNKKWVAFHVSSPESYFLSGTSLATINSQVLQHARWLIGEVVMCEEQSNQV